MALWMEEHSQPMTEAERADLDAIIALKEAAALELKEKGNEYVKMGKKHYPDAIDSYTRAINQKILGESESSILFANRAHVNLLLGNFRRALMDAEEAVKLCPANVKAYYRAAKATFSLDLLAEALLFCQRGLEQFPTNEELKKLAKQIESRQNENEKRKAQVSEALASAKDLVSAMESRHLKMGKAMYQVLTGMKKATLDKSNILHWPVLLLYAEAGNGILLSKREVLHNLLEGTPGAVADIVDDQKEDEDHHSCNTKSSGKWIKVNEKKTLHDVIQQPDYVIPGIPVFYVVSKRSAFYRDFTAGKWIPP
ncbi:tetratricopeptide repeat protein 4 homolog isoform X3 [Amborella trichopoda]|uniref:Uncharacterized protein n=1 Tax=Amborella trichopoda TaxID=13333 RepID=W1PY15_AMBTC|nr:tetratricopeptide repeat protein 4 homolog isoform X3 [Amborella trichopoda]ERN12934.1 hypothetical protein AMTR_s00050p00215890 [Amborella trichopoda]|eukprot:XP_020527230.1 tetratricopeptide repeat protein 4 homolog isoform X3 [Amborella trichopoda]